MKKIISILLVTAMLLSALCMNVSAAERSETEIKLEYLVDCIRIYNSFYGRAVAYDVGIPSTAYIEAIKVLENSDSTEEDYGKALNKLVNTNLYESYIYPSVARDTYNNAIKEQNYNNWYSEEEWADYQSKLNDLKLAIEGLSNPNGYFSLDANSQQLQEMRNLTEAFHAVLKAYNKMTNKYTLKGDLDKDGTVSVLDVTLLQKYLAESEELTGAQKMLTGANMYEDLEIIDATNLSKYIVEISDLPGKDIFISDLGLSYVDEELLMERIFNFSICPRIFETPVRAKNGYTNLDYLYGYFRFCSENGYDIYA